MLTWNVGGLGEERGLLERMAAVVRHVRAARPHVGALLHLLVALASGDVALYPSKDALLGALQAQHERNTQAVQQADFLKMPFIFNKSCAAGTFCRKADWYSQKSAPQAEMKT